MMISSVDCDPLVGSICFVFGILVFFYFAARIESRKEDETDKAFLRGVEVGRLEALKERLEADIKKKKRKQ